MEGKGLERGVVRDNVENAVEGKMGGGKSAQVESGEICAQHRGGPFERCVLQGQCAEVREH